MQGLDDARLEELLDLFLRLLVLRLAALREGDPEELGF